MSHTQRSTVPPRARDRRAREPLTEPGRPPPSRRQEVLLVLSQIIAKRLPAAVRKEAGHERL